jgi:hypothetical protein
MPPFLCKRPSTNPRVLDANDCPPHNLAHDLTSYPLFYDPLYYPSHHSAVFATADTFCRWLESALVTHTHSCCKCRASTCAIAVTLHVLHIIVSVDDTLMSFLLPTLSPLLAFIVVLLNGTSYVRMGCPSRPACFLVLHGIPPGSRTLLTAIAWLYLHCLLLFSTLWLII